MLQSPVTGGYPGKYVCFAMATFFAAILWRSIRFAIRAVKAQREAIAQGISFKPEAKKSVGASIFVALSAACLLVMTLFAIYKAWPQ